EGIPWAGARLHQLPAIKAGPAGYADLVDAAGRPVDDALRERRRRQLLAELEAIRPDIVLIEAFPFGRRALRFELLPLVEAAAAQAPPALVVSSIRDILHENRKARLNDETVDLLRRHFDLVLVHGDPGLIPIEASFPRADAIADLVRYTGLVAAGPGTPMPGGPSSPAPTCPNRCGGTSNGRPVPASPSGASSPTCRPRWRRRGCRCRSAATTPPPTSWPPAAGRCSCRSPTRARPNRCAAPGCWRRATSPSWSRSRSSRRPASPRRSMPPMRCRRRTRPRCRTSAVRRAAPGS